MIWSIAISYSFFFCNEPQDYVLCCALYLWFQLQFFPYKRNICLLCFTHMLYDLAINRCDNITYVGVYFLPIMSYNKGVCVLFIMSVCMIQCFCSRLPGWVQSMIPRVFYITEKAWNYYPVTITGLTNHPYSSVAIFFSITVCG
jgi:hypothetical protein